MMGESLRMTIGSEILSVIFCLGLLCTVKSQTTVQFCGNTPADVVFLLDSSNSMWAPHFQQQLEFVSNVTQMFEIGETATQVGLATFNDDVQLQFYLNEYRDKNRLIKAIGLVQQTHGASTATDLALKFLRIRLFHSRYGARPGVPHIAIVITDGQSDNTLKTLIEATKVKRNNINIFTIGVGRAANRREIERMASSPSNEYAFVVDNFSFLSSIKEKLAIRTCKVTVLPTTVEMSIPTSTTTTLSSTLGITTTTTTEATTTLAETTTSTTPTTVTIPTIASTTTTTTTTTLPTSTAASMSTTITTTDSPTTTKPLSTTTNWVDIARKICDKKVVDIVFALDSSDVVTAQDFWYQVKFVRDLTMGLDIGPNKTRIGVIIYSDKVVHVFDVNDHASLSSAISALYGVDRIQGGTRIDKVIHYVRTKGFRRTVSRQEAAQLLVLVTASATENLHRVKKEANKARSAGVNILTIGVGDKVNTEELSIIAGVDNNGKEKMFYDFSPFLDVSSQRRQLFHSKSFMELDLILMETTIEACTAEVALVPVSDQACGSRQEADMVFIMDSASAGKKNTKKSLDFIKNVTSAMDVSEETIQIGMLQPDYCIPKTESFSLNSNSDKQHVASALQQPPDDDKLFTLLKNMRKDSFRPKKGGRKDAKKIAVVLVDGNLEHPMKVLKEAKRAQVNGIQMIVIFVGCDPPQPEVMDMCTYPTAKHFIQVSDYDKLKDLEQSVIELLCDEL